MNTVSNKPESFFRLVFRFAAPLASVVLMIFGSFFYTTFLSVFLNNGGYAKEAIGLIHSAFFLGMFIGAFQMESLIRKVGHIQALAVFGSLATTSTLLQALCQYFPAWVVLRFVFGLSLAALYIVIESWLLCKSCVKTRGVILSLYMIALYGSQSISQQILTFINMDGITPFLIAALFTSLSVIPVGLSTNRLTLPPPIKKIGFFHILSSSPFGVSGCFISGLVLSTLYSFLPLFALTQSIPSEHLMTLTIGGGALLQWPIGKLSDYFERRKTLLSIVLSGLLISLVGFLYTGAPVSFVCVTGFILGGFLFTLYPLSVTQVCDHLDDSHITKATSLLLISHGLGCVLGPLTSSIVVDRWGSQALFLYFTVVLGILCCVGLYSMIRRPIVPLDQQTDFHSLPTVTPVAYEMDPRNENGEM